MPLFSKRKMLDGKKIVPMPRGRSDSLFRKLERRQMIVESRDGHMIEPIMEVRITWYLDHITNLEAQQDINIM